MGHSARVLLILIALCPALASAQATLNKCIDAQGLVTYTNKPCLNAREVHKLEIDPAPLPAPIQQSNGPVSEPPVKSAVTPAITRSAPATVRVETRQISGKPAQPNDNSSHCNTLSGKLGRVLDKMDQARRKGYTQEQMNQWNEEARDLERKKQQSACF
tara:strand:+ start:164 stop:640 length:477 start_codon:yes stop_codon:yes gene_type:complete